MNRSILFLVILVSSICNVANGQCPYGTYTTNPAVSWVSNGNLDSYTTISENTQNDTGGKLYSDGANVVYSSSTSFQAGDVITIRGNYQNDSRRGPLVLTSVGSAALNSGSVMNNAFPANAWGDVTYTIPAGTTSFSQLNITGATDNGVYVNIDVVKITRAACYTCDINVAPVLSATTVSNVCPANTFNLNSITASNTPAGAELTWHTGTPATNANRIASPGTASGFRFYAAFHSIANNCYSGVNGAATTVVNTDGDSDCDGIPNNIDLDDDNDGIPDKVECPSYFKNLTGSRGFSDATAPSNWYYANSSSNFDVSTSAAITYGSTNKNSTLTGGLFDEIDGVNTTGGLQNVLVENPEPVALVCKLSEMLVAGVSYEYAFDLGARSTGNTSHHYYVKIFNADLDIVVDTLESGLLSSLPLYASSPNFKNFAGTFTVPSTGNYYLLFTTEGAGNSDDDYLIDRVAMRGEVNLCDTDGDGIPNLLDLDSDNDGCPDLKEAGVSPLTDVITPSTALAGSFGIAPGALAGSQLNPAATDANNDGLNDSVDPDLNGQTNYPSTYSLYALSSTRNFCADKDGDGIPDIDDIDDDNDGILDAVESPSCFYTSAEVAIPSAVSTEIPTTGTIANVYDNNTATTFAFTATTAANALNKTIFEITPYSPVQASSIIINYSTATGNALGTTANSVRVDGWNGTTWATLATLTPAAASANLQTLAIPAGSQATYQKYRLYDLNAAISTTVIREVTLGIPASYVASAHPKATCSVDTDGDGIPNHQDLDSDGDGCSDASETGVTGTLLPGTMVNNSGIVYSPSAIAQGPYGINGFANPLETSASPESGVYTGSYSNYSNATNSSIHTCSVQPQPKPDINIGYVNDVIRGNLSVNDVIPAGSTYGSLTLVPGYTNPGNEMPVVNSDGTYTFTAATPGIYQFYVSVCPPSVSTGCQPVLLTIEVLNGYVETNKPVASPDFATVKMNQPVTLKTLSNDRAGNNYTTLQPSSVTITALPKNGTATVNTITGDITYTPANGFTGQDTLSYSVCDDGSPSANCNTSYQIITVLPATAANSVTASDDYLFVPQGTTGSGNVLTNDYDPEGNTLTVTPQTLTVDEGKLTLLSNGSFTFEAAGSFTGAVNFPYDVCDNGSPVACTRATIYILVPSASTLPLELLTFTAVKENSSTTGLRWTTASEINTSHFVIERMINGSGRWEAIGRVNTTGNGGTSVNSYYFPDRQPAAGINYYRLKQVDEDGRYKYSHVCLVSYGDTKINTSIYPNPADDYAIIQGLELSHATIHIYDALGQQLDGMIRVEQVSLHQLKVQLYRLTPGMYIIKVNGQALKLLKK